MSSALSRERLRMRKKLYLKHSLSLEQVKKKPYVSVIFQAKKSEDRPDCRKDNQTVGEDE
ncbi:hypothetical protein M378DRAFT_873620 [Amanita muscaria Koide BX008]|uniref:Uncharacterized protein n=1 Tax=Amanita muscaria (strain Koide BX008) TaxID=946122 RepID=A0A0C2WVZ2_AMAMK|nr:hypothetical protein M378DRAFT_873620 [Amanita muscaria Koide BX008]